MDLSDEAKAEIKSAIDILKSDGIHIHKTYKQFMASQENPPTDPKNPPADPKNPPKTEGNPPPPKPGDPPTDPTPKKAGLWWGTKE
jgi:hypothetical protein